MTRSASLLPILTLGWLLASAAIGWAQPATKKIMPEPLAKPGIVAPSDSEFRKGLSAYNGGDFRKAIEIWQPLAEHEDAPSQAGLGFIYHRGMGVAIDQKKAAYWLRKAAEHGQPEGQLMLGSLYFYGQGVAQSYVQAYAWCDLAQDGGNSDAQSCRDAALQSLRSNADVKEAFRLSVDLHHRFGQQNPAR